MSGFSRSYFVTKIEKIVFFVVLPKTSSKVSSMTSIGASSRFESAKLIA